MSKIAVIDLGTNTFNLLIAQVIEQKFSYEILHSSKISVKLGEGTITQNIIQETSIQRALDALYEFKKIYTPYSVDTVVAIGTSAIRNAQNKADFLNRIKETHDITIDVIDGPREAELIYKGVRESVFFSKDYNSLIIDIGGGSVEFIICNKNGIIWKGSFEIGVARLLQKFNPSDVISPKQITTIQQYLKKQLFLLEVAIKSFGVQELVGASGTFDTFSEIIMQEHNYYTAENKFSNYKYDVEKLKNLFKQLYKTSAAQRAQIPGLAAMRVDMIVMASVCTEFIIQEYNIKNVKHATNSLKEGLLSELVQKRNI